MNDAQPAQTSPADSSTNDPRAEFRQLMGLFTTGVCVVAVEGAEGGVAAMTVNSLVSVSLEPRLICWSLQNASSQFASYADADCFSVSILAQDQAELAARYAKRGDSMLEQGDFERSAQGLPVMAGGLGYLECRRWSEFLAGDHTMIFGEVTGLSKAAAGHARTSPLGFFNGQFCAIEP